MSNMKIWEAVEKTDPKFTKHIAQRGGFTAVNANSQIMAATKQFGPCGEGWGYTSLPPIFTPDNQIIIPVTLWHGTRENVFGPEYGCADLVSDKGRKDSDAPKKATTDALTKLLSRLGFNADVFLGRYDDQKYVQEVSREFAEKHPTLSDEQQARLTAELEARSIPPAALLKAAKDNLGTDVASVKDLPASAFNDALGWIQSQPKKEKEAA